MRRPKQRKYGSKILYRELEKQTHLMPRHRILHQTQMRQPLEMAERIQIGQLGEVVGREDQGLEIGQAVGQRGLDTVGPVAR